MQLKKIALVIIILIASAFAGVYTVMATDWSLIGMHRVEDEVYGDCVVMMSNYRDEHIEECSDMIGDNNMMNMMRGYGGHTMNDNSDTMMSNFGGFIAQLLI
jgi:hypothetical protein